MPCAAYVATMTPALLDLAEAYKSRKHTYTGSDKEKKFPSLDALKAIKKRNPKFVTVRLSAIVNAWVGTDGPKIGSGTLKNLVTELGELLHARVPGCVNYNGNDSMHIRVRSASMAANTPCEGVLGLDSRLLVLKGNW